MLAGLVQCQFCGRRLDSHWVNDRPGYRCHHGHTSARKRPPELAKNVYIREDHLLNDLRAQFAETVGDDAAAIAEYLRSNDLTLTPLEGQRIRLNQSGYPVVGNAQQGLRLPGLHDRRTQLCGKERELVALGGYLKIAMGCTISSPLCGSQSSTRPRHWAWNVPSGTSSASRNPRMPQRKRTRGADDGSAGSP